MKSSRAILFLTILIDLIGFGMVIPFLSYYAREYGASGVMVGAVVGVYSIMQFFFAPVWGRVSDHIGRRPVLMISISASLIGYLLFAFTQSLPLLFLSRIIAGAGGGNLGVAQAYISDVTTPQERAKGMGMIGAAFGIGFILGPPLSGILSAVGIRNGLPGNLLPGVVAATLSLGALTMAWRLLGESKPAGVVPPRGIPPQFDARVWREIGTTPTLAALMSGIFLTILATASMETSVTLHGRDRFGFQQIDLAYLFLFMGVIVASIQGGLIGRLARRFGERRLIMIGAACFTAGFLAVPSIYRLPLLYAVAALVAVGQGVLYPAHTSLVSRAVREEERGSILGLAAAVASLARFTGPVLSGFLYDSAGAAIAFYGAALATAASFFIALALHKPEQEKAGINDGNPESGAAGSSRPARTSI